MLINNVNVAICLLDALFDGCHNSKIVSLSISTLYSGQKRLPQVSLSVFFHCFAFFWSQQCASIGILCTIISCFSQSKLSWRVVLHIVLIIKNTNNISPDSVQPLICCFASDLHQSSLSTNIL